MRNEELAIQVRPKAAGLKFLGDIVKMFVVARKGIDKIYAERHPSVGVRRQLPFQGSLWGKQPFVKPPLQGEVSPKVTEGCIAAHPYRYPLQDARKARRGCPARCRTPPAVSPETLRSAARGRT